MSDFVFRRGSSGAVEFRGDFEGLYNSEADPWGQSGSGDNSLMNEFYRVSRQLVCDRVAVAVEELSHRHEVVRVCEVGSGSGYVTKMLCDRVPGATVTGVDISQTAVDKARALFPRIRFEVHDILQSRLRDRVNVVILSNLLWYVIHDLRGLTENVIGSFDRGSVGVIIVQNALFKSSQSYGAGLISSIGDMTDVFLAHAAEFVELSAVTTEFRRSAGMQYDFGVVCISVAN
jgi:hypothetical protein